MTDHVAFEDLIAPVPAEHFFAEHYEQRPLRIARGQPDFYGGLLTLDRLDRYLMSGVARYPDVVMVQHETDVPSADYVGPDDRIDAARLYRRLAEGATVVVNHLERQLPSLAALCRAAEHRFGMPFQTNVYLTPPGAQCFRTHYDTHDVFVLQVDGTKEWSVYDTCLALPLPGQGFDRDRDRPGALTDRFTLAAGDLFYCPRGVMHDARSTDRLSLHITFGLLGKTWAELMLDAVAAACLDRPALRRNLPAGFAAPDYDRTALRTAFTGLLAELQREPERVDAALDRMIDCFIAQRSPALAGHLAERLGAAALALDTPLQPRPDLIWRLSVSGESLTLLANGCEIRMPAFTAAAVAALLAGPPVAPRSLPGDLDDAERLVLARRLLRDGLLVRAA